MSFTGRIGSPDSLLGSIIFGTDTAEDGGVDLEQDASNSLALSGVAVCHRLRAGVATSTLAFAQLATPFNTVDEDVDTTLSLAGAATGHRLAFRSASSTLAFAETVNQNIKYQSVSQSLAFVQTALDSGSKRVQVGNTLNFVQDEEGSRGVANESVSDILVLHDLAGRTFSKTASSTLTFTDIGKRFIGAVHTLAFVQTATPARGGDPTDALVFLSTASAAGSIYRRSLSDSLGFVSAATYELEGNCTTRAYTPFVGTGGDTSYTAPTTTQPTLGAATLTLTNPYVSPTTTLELRNPDFSNRDVLQFNRIKRETRGGTLVVFADTTWPKSQTLKITVSNLSQSQAQDVKAFLTASLGKEIGLLDHEDRQWKGLILNPDSAVSQPGKFNYSLELDFEGELV